MGLKTIVSHVNSIDDYHVYDLTSPIECRPRNHNQLQLNELPSHHQITASVQNKNYETRRALSGAHVPPTKLFPRLAVNKTILKPRVAAATGA